MRTPEALVAKLERVRNISLIVGVVGLLIAAASWASQPELFFRSYLLAFVYWIGISLGSLSLLLLHHLVGGRWGWIIRRILEAALGTLPLMLLLFLPLIFGVEVLYEWAKPEAVNDEILLQKAAYLNTPFFLIRTAIYFAIWLLLAYILNKRSVQQDDTGDPELSRKFQIVSGPGLVLYGVTVTFAAIDWGMSLEPHWFSTIYGLLFLIGFALIAISFAVIVLRRLSSHEPVASVVGQNHFHDLGNLMLAFVMLWAYMGFSQYLIIWSANLPEEVPWYVHRLHGGWQYLGVFLIVFHFAIPFALLLMRVTKKKSSVLFRLAAAILFLRLADLVFLLIPPVSHGAGLNIQWTDPICLIGVGGLWMAVFASRLKSRPLLPLNDPLTAEAFSQKGDPEHG
jgi:hypothetical protein